MRSNFSDPPPQYTPVERTPLLYPHSHPRAVLQLNRNYNHADEPQETSINKRRSSHCSKFLLVFIIGLILGHCSIRIHWKLQHAAHARWLKEVKRARTKWEAEKRQHEIDEKLEDERRKRAGLVWGPIFRGHCLRYQTRHYSAQLLNVPDGLDPIKECRMLGLEINGKVFKPDECDKLGSNGVLGNWHINYGEATCTTWWTAPSDMGCTAEGSGYRRFEARLMNVERGDSWERMCESTPIHFRQYTFNGPDICHNRIYGMYGFWDILSDECRRLVLNSDAVSSEES